MTHTRRSTPVAAFLVAVALLTAACAPGTGPLGTPASPAVSPDASGAPIPSDVVAPESPSDGATPSVEPSSSTEPAPTSPSASAAPTPTASPVATTLVRAYFMHGSFTDNAGLVPVLRKVPETKALARAAMTALLEGPKGAELEASPAMYTSIPDGVKLLDLAISDGIATVVLSREWTDKMAFTVGSATAQVVYTLTQFSTVDKVRLEIEGDGAKATARRSDFQQLGLLPAIFVDRPAWGAAAGNPMRLTGIANVFEAQFMVQVLDGKGHVLVEQPVTASCGTGCWGTFKTDVAYEIGKAQYGTLRVFEMSARDGSPVSVTEYRVWLTP